VRRLDFLIKKVRFNSNNLDENRFSDLEISTFFNDAQRHIQNIIVQNNPRNDLFSSEYILETSDGTEEYLLPPDIFAVSAINSVDIRSGGSKNKFYPVRALSNSDRGTGLGYIIRGNKIIFTPIPERTVINGARIIYVRKLYDIGPRFGKITSVTGNTVVFDSLVDEGLEIVNYSDFISVVDVDGEFKSKKIRIDNYDATGISHTVTTSDDLSDVQIGDYSMSGENTTTHSELPDVCELTLTNFVERTIHTVDSSADMSSSNNLTNEERSAIIELFKSTPQDPAYPPIFSDEYIIR